MTDVLSESWKASNSPMSNDDSVTLEPRDQNLQLKEIIIFHQVQNLSRCPTVSCLNALQKLCFWAALVIVVQVFFRNKQVCSLPEVL